MDYMNSIQILWTLIAFIVFVGIFIWAWSSKRKDEFKDAAHLVFDENDDPSLNSIKHQPKSGN